MHEVMRYDISNHYTIHCPYFERLMTTLPIFTNMLNLLTSHTIAHVQNINEAECLLERKIENPVNKFAPFRPSPCIATINLLYWRSKDLLHLIDLAFKVFAQTGFHENSVELKHSRVLRKKVSNAIEMQTRQQLV